MFLFSETKRKLFVNIKYPQKSLLHFSENPKLNETLLFRNPRRTTLKLCFRNHNATFIQSGRCLDNLDARKVVHDRTCVEIAFEEAPNEVVTHICLCWLGFERDNFVQNLFVTFCWPFKYHTTKQIKSLCRGQRRKRKRSTYV